MTIYNINLGIGWASAVLNTAQAYRAGVFRKLNLSSKFIFTDMILADNIQHLTANIGLMMSKLFGFIITLQISRLHQLV